jgi:hypothetical protein
MASFLTAHFHNVLTGKEVALSGAIHGAHRAAVARLRGFRAAQRFEVTPQQIMSAIPQPWRYVTLYDFELDDPTIDLPAIAPHLADLRDAGLIASDGTERIYSYRMYSQWLYSKNYRRGPLSHLMLLLANVIPGRETEYHRWYDEQHRHEVSQSPGYVGMRRGQLSAVQVPPVHYCPGDQLILGGMQTEDLAATIKEFIDRAVGTSPSGIAWGVRSDAASTARTVHVFKSIDGPFAAEAVDQ